MPIFPIRDGGQQAQNAGAVAATSKGTVLTANAATNNKAATWTEIIAATAFNATQVMFMFSDCALAVDYLVDIAFGASGSEVVKIKNLLVSGAGTGSTVYGAHYMFPILVPVGTRIAARCQATTGSSTVAVSCLLFGGGFAEADPFTIVDTYGDNIADSAGTSIDPGATANAKGAYTQITSSTLHYHRLLVVAVGNQLNTTRASQSWQVDIAKGGAGSEIIVVPNLVLNASTANDVLMPQTYNLLPVNIPANKRIAARAQSDGTNATDRLLDLVVYGVG